MKVEVTIIQNKTVSIWVTCFFSIMVMSSSRRNHQSLAVTHHPILSLFWRGLRSWKFSFVSKAEPVSAKEWRQVAWTKCHLSHVTVISSQFLISLYGGCHSPSSLPTAWRSSRGERHRQFNSPVTPSVWQRRQGTSTAARTRCVKCILSHACMRGEHSHTFTFVLEVLLGTLIRRLKHCATVEGASVKYGIQSVSLQWPNTKTTKCREIVCHNKY